jgi:integrase/recombinase XerC/integrase/recombinase XerD
MTSESGKKTNSDIRAKTWLEPASIEGMLTACYADQFAEYLQLRNETILALFADTGLRVNELSLLDVEMLRENASALYLPTRIQKDHPTGKSPAPVTMDLEPGVTRKINSYLTSRWKDTEALFPSRKADRIGTQGIRYMVSLVAEAADVRPWLVDGGEGEPSDVSPHTLRHSVAYRMLHVESGNTLYDVRNRLRHSTIVTTERVYDHFRRI